MGLSGSGEEIYKEKEPQVNPPTLEVINTWQSADQLKT